MNKQISHRVLRIFPSHRLENTVKEETLNMKIVLLFYSIIGTIMGDDSGIMYVRNFKWSSCYCTVFRNIFKKSNKIFIQTLLRNTQYGLITQQNISKSQSIFEWVIYKQTLSNLYIFNDRIRKEKKNILKEETKMGECITKIN